MTQSTFRRSCLRQASDLVTGIEEVVRPVSVVSVCSPTLIPRIGICMHEISWVTVLAGLVSRRRLIQAVSVALLAHGDMIHCSYSVILIPITEMGVIGMAGVARDPRDPAFQIRAVAELARCGVYSQDSVNLPIAPIGASQGGGIVGEIGRMAIVTGLITRRCLIEAGTVAGFADGDLCQGGLSVIPIIVGIDRMTRIARDPRESSLQIRPMALGGAVDLPVIQDVLPMIFLLCPVGFMGIKGMTGIAGGWKFLTIGRNLVTLEARLRTGLEDANAVGRGIAPTLLVRKDMGTRCGDIPQRQPFFLRR